MAGECSSAAKLSTTLTLRFFSATVHSNSFSIETECIITTEHRINWSGFTDRTNDTDEIVAEWKQESGQLGNRTVF